MRPRRLLNLGSLIVLCLVVLSCMVSRASAFLLIPTAVEVRLVGFEGSVNAKVLQQALDSLASSDNELVGLLRVGFTYSVRLYDVRLGSLEFSRALRKGSALADADEVDAQIADKHDQFSGYVIYLLFSKTRRRAYAADPTARDGKSCTTQVWASTRGRFTWIDLAATESLEEFGPATKGDGFVSRGRSVPDIGQHHLTSFSFKLAALCHKTVLHHALPSPSLSLPVVVPNVVLRIRVIVMSSYSSPQVKDTWTERVVKPLREVAILTNHQMHVEIDTLTFNDCPECAAAHEMSIRLGNVTDKIDHGILCNVLLNSVYPRVIKGLPVFNVFVVRTAEGPLRLDSAQRQVAHTNDCIVAVESNMKESMVTSDFVCGKSGRVQIDEGDVTREVLASVLERVFGIAPSQSSFSTAIGDFRQDFLYAVGHTPFGHFSRSTTLARTITDAAWRNPLLADLAQTTDVINKLRIQSSQFSFEKKKEFNAAIDEAEACLRRSASFIGLFDIEHSRDLAFEARGHAELAKRIFEELIVVEDCYLPSGDDDEAAIHTTSAGLIPFLLVFVLGAIVYETRMTRLRSLISRPPGSAIQNRIRYRDHKSFAAPAKKLD